MCILYYNAEIEETLKRWHAARFGMMIHWGLYSIPGGIWNGVEMEYIGEWLMSRFRIPVAEYEKLAAEFNPLKFDAEEWVKLAKTAGMRYIVYTAKHHDGFAMYHSKCDPYNIVDATPCKRDPLKELQIACEKHGLILSLYYSQTLDWHERNAGGWNGPEGNKTNFGMSWCNNWDFPDMESKEFEKYFRKKVKPQIEELLTQYGNIGAMWFDTPNNMKRKYSEEIYETVKSLQPNCLINSRLGNGLGDYKSLGDNMIPACNLEGNWEAPATMNDTWGYKKNDNNWKSAKDILEILTGLAGKGANYLLNVGPTEEGLIPEGSIKVLQQVGEWMSKNSEAIHGTSPTPFEGDLEYGPVTIKDSKLYLHLNRWPDGNVILNGIKRKAKRAYILEDACKELNFSQKLNEKYQFGLLEVSIPDKRPSALSNVLTIDFEGEINVDKGLYQRGTGNILLQSPFARIEKYKTIKAVDRLHETFVNTEGEILERESEVSISPIGATTNWFSEDTALIWKFQVFYPGRFTVRIATTGLHHSNPWMGGHKIRIKVAGQELVAVLKKHEEILNASAECYKQAISYCGDIVLKESGKYELQLSADDIVKNDVGLCVMQVLLKAEPYNVLQIP